MLFDFLRRSRVTAKQNRGQDILPGQLIPRLEAELAQHFGPLIPQKIKSHPTQSKLATKVFAVKPMKANSVKAMFEDMDFAVLTNTQAGVVSGTRRDLPRETTVVSYFATNGLLIISSTLYLIDV